MQSVGGPVLGSVPLTVMYYSKPESVYYSTKAKFTTANTITNGCHVKYTWSQLPPIIHIGGTRDDRFALVLVDCGAANNDSYQGEWAHWVVVDIPGGTEPDPIDPLEGREVLPYERLNIDPKEGIRRYEIILFKQNSWKLDLKKQVERTNFSTIEFAIDHNFGFPVAAVQFYGYPPVPRNACKSDNAKE